ncbi:unnamed protein product [Ceratitis capitata]|uniref:(Mediterranean fruit fly) hypothetical protein n=1 Tax=Ceratitis capitata TaxID=7213 RepID=A0A811UTJ5_CERCA|nr:unnamed protein product [Ceratitis capitata]
MLAAAETEVFDSSTWLLDSEATAHVCSNRNLFVMLKQHKEKICLAGGVGDVRKRYIIDFSEMVSIESEDEADDSDDMFEEAKGGSDSGSDYQESVCESPIQEECPVQIGRGRPKLVRSGKSRCPRKCTIQ